MYGDWIRAECVETKVSRNPIILNDFVNVKRVPTCVLAPGPTFVNAALTMSIAQLRKYFIERSFAKNFGFPPN